MFGSCPPELVCVSSTVAELALVVVGLGFALAAVLVAARRAR